MMADPEKTRKPTVVRSVCLLSNNKRKVKRKMLGPFDFNVTLTAKDGDGKQSGLAVIRGISAFSPVTALKAALNQLEDESLEVEGRNKVYLDLNDGTDLSIEVTFDNDQFS